MRYTKVFIHGYEFRKYIIHMNGQENRVEGSVTLSHHISTMLLNHIHDNKYVTFKTVERKHNVKITTGDTYIRVKHEFDNKYTIDRALYDLIDLLKIDMNDLKRNNRLPDRSPPEQKPQVPVPDAVPLPHASYQYMQPVPSPAPVSEMQAPQQPQNIVVIKNPSPYLLTNLLLNNIHFSIYPETVLNV
jgi:hypothetical protein